MILLRSDASIFEIILVFEEKAHSAIIAKSLEKAMLRASLIYRRADITDLSVWARMANHLDSRRGLAVGVAASGVGGTLRGAQANAGR